MNVIRSLVALVLLPAVALAQDTYSVHLARPVKVGERFKVAARVAFISKTSTELDKEPATEEEVNLAAKVSGELTIVAVNPKGMAKELTLKLDAAETFEDGETAEIFGVGDLIALKHGNEKDEVTVNGEEPGDEQAELIDVLMKVAGDEEATDDEAFGIETKVKVGEEWMAHKDVLAHEMDRQQIKGLKASDLTAYAKLIETTTVAGEPALRVDCTMAFANRKAHLRNLEEGMKAESVSAELHTLLDVPVDPNSTATRAKSTMKFNVRTKGMIQDEEGQSVPVHVNVERRAAIDATETPIK